MGCTTSKNVAKTNEIAVRSKERLLVQEERRVSVISSHSQTYYGRRREYPLLSTSPNASNKDITGTESIKRVSSLKVLLNDSELNISANIEAQSSTEETPMTKKHSLNSKQSVYSEYIFDILKHSPSSLKRPSSISSDIDSPTLPTMYFYQHSDEETSSTVSNSLRSYSTTLDPLASEDRINRYDLDEIVKLKQQLHREEFKTLSDYKFP
ncbi:hypothetical protein ABK040_011997 [Willaertia magna]